MRIIDETVLDSRAVAAAGQTAAIDCGHCALLAVQVKLIANGANGVVKLQESVDGITWFDTADTVTAINGTITALWKKIDIAPRYYRLDYTRVAAYDAEIKVYAKGV